MPNDPLPRDASTEDWIRAGEDSLREHLQAQAVVAHHKYSPLEFGKLDQFLQDPDCLRYPVRLTFEFGSMAPHQFAQPEIDVRSVERDGRVLCLRPMLKERPDWILLAAAYMVPVINYGEVANDTHCLRYGATLLGKMEGEFYAEICALADAVGAELRVES